MAGRTGSADLNDTVPEIRVGIVSWNTAGHLDRCLAALPAALDGLDAEIVVVDNDSSDDSVAVARRHGATTIVNEANLGYAVAMNQALDSDAPVLIALNPDTVPAPGTLAALVDRLGREPDAGIVVPRLVGEEGEHQHSAYRFPAPGLFLAAATSTTVSRRGSIGRRLLLESSGPHVDGPVDWAIGAVHVIRRSSLQGERPYCERSFMYAEDLDLCWRLRQRGVATVLAADVSIVHIGNVAGAMAWGDGRSVRYLEATYDVVAERVGGWRARLLAVVGALSVMIVIVRLWVADVRRRRPVGRDQFRLPSAELRVHVRSAVTGSRPAIGPPASE